MGAKKLILYLTAGYPDGSRFARAASVAADEGVDILEIGLPFSDPVADGPVIQAASAVAIRSGVTFERTLAMSARLPQSLPRVLMTYANPIFVRGWSRAFSLARSAGFSGAILPDIPVEELASIEPFRPPGFYLVPFVAPTTSPDRLSRICRTARDGAFIYLVSLRGITGARIGDTVAEEVTAVTRRIRRLTHAPVYVGFGIRTAADAEKFGRCADGVIVGSSALAALGRGLAPFARLIRQMRRKLDRLD